MDEGAEELAVQTDLGVRIAVCLRKCTVLGTAGASNMTQNRLWPRKDETSPFGIWPVTTGG